MLNGHPDPTQTPLDRGLKAAVGVTAAGALAAALLWGPREASGWVAGGVWNVLNVFLLKKLTALLGAQEARRTSRAVRLLALKFGGLYPAGIWLLWSGAVPVVGFALGFTAVLATVAAGFLARRPVRVSHV